MFDSFVIVDWSAASQPKMGRDSIWICAVDRDGAERLVENPRTRHSAKNLLGELLSDATARSERVLLGFDFPFGYPAGFAQREASVRQARRTWAGCACWSWTM